LNERDDIAGSDSIRTGSGGRVRYGAAFCFIAASEGDGAVDPSQCRVPAIAYPCYLMRLCLMRREPPENNE
jgi:hypothetical protein